MNAEKPQLSLEGVGTCNATAPVIETGYLVTNNKNLLYMLSAGLLLPSSCFGERYYQDTLACCRGWIPFFVSFPPKAAVEFCISEASYLRPCIVEVSFENIAGPVQALSGHVMEPRELSRIAPGEAELIYVPAPIPISAVKRVLFASNDDKKVCEADVKNYRNVSWAGLKKSRLKRLFQSSSNAMWPPANVPEQREIPFAQVQAAGGILSMLRLMSNRCISVLSGQNQSLGVAVAVTAFETNVKSMPALANTVFSEFADWIHVGRTEGNRSSPESRSGKLGSLFWQAVNRIVKEGCAVAGTENGDERVLLEFLEVESAEFRGELKRNIVELQRDLQSLIGLGDIRITELFEKYKSSFSRSLVLFFLIEDSTSIVEFNEPGLNDEDLLAAAVLFGARDGFISLPSVLRGGETATLAISHRMASLSHRIQNTGIYFADPPSRPTALVESFLGEWNDLVQADALRIARKQRWNCIQTHVKIRFGEYQMNVERGGTVFILEGEPKAVETKVLKHKFLTHLAEAIQISPEIEAQIRKELRSAGNE